MSVAGLAGLLFALTLSAGPAAAATPNCGGKGQKICTTEKATFVKNACPKGSFFDPRKGGECWQCPSGTHRTIFPVNEKKACERRASSKFSKAKYLGKTKNPKPSRAFHDPRKGGEWWRCPKNRPRRTAYAVTDKRACATKNIIGEKLSKAEYLGKVDAPKPKGAFVDPRKGGEYWTCSGAKRTVFSVTSSKACEEVTKAALMKAEYKGKFGCKKGSFFDPRKGGECWSCPSDYFRNANPVTHKAACTINVGKACDSGNVDVRGKCYKKNECGKKNQRPCLIVERVPSFNKGLAEDFIANKCIPTNTAICLTAVRVLKAGKKVGEIAKQVKKVVPNFDGLGKLAGEAAKKAGKAFNSKKAKNDFINLVSKQIGPYGDTLKEVEAIGRQSAKNVKTFINIFSNEKFCTMTPAQRKSQLAKLKLKPEKTFKKAGILENLFIKSANAADGHFYMTYGITASAGAVIGGSFTFTVATDYRDNIGAFIGIGPGIITNVAGGASFDIGFYPKASLDDFAGWGHSFALAGGPFKIVSGGIGIAIDEEFKDVQGFGVSVGAGAGILPADFSYGAAHDWKL